MYLHEQPIQLDKHLNLFFCLYIYSIFIANIYCTIIFYKSALPYISENDVQSDQ